MTVDTDDSLIWLISDCFRNTLRRLIRIEPVLDHITFLEREQKERIITKARNECNQTAVDLLIDTIVSKARQPGWSREFVQALSSAGCSYAAQIVETETLASPSLEAENDCCVHLITLLGPSLLDMKTTDVCDACFQGNLITDEDRQNILAETTNKGPIGGARLLLSRIVLQPPGWFSRFLDALRNTEHFDLLEELTGVRRGLEDDASPQKSGSSDVSAGEQEGKSEEEEEEDEDDARQEEQREEKQEAEKEEEKKEQREKEEGKEQREEEEKEQREEEEETEQREEEEEKKEQREEEKEARKEEEEKEEEEEETQRSMKDLTSESGHNDEDLYTAQSEMLEGPLTANESSDSPDPVSSEGYGGPEAPLTLWPYQLRVAEPALRGQNVIVCLPTGSGKTRIAVYAAKQHLDRRRQQGAPAKVMVIVNKVLLVEQHFTKEFGKFLKDEYRLEQTSGFSPNKQAFANTVAGHDVIICTAQILHNALLDSEDGISLSDITLLIVDECHHTQKGGVYQKIMIHYLTDKLLNIKRRKAGSDIKPLPQILGLTASLGVGGASKREKAQEHILRICANLDVSEIMTAPLGDHSKGRCKQIIMAKRRTQDPFGDVIRRVMTSIQEHAQLSPSVGLGTQCYEQWVVDKEKEAAREGDQRKRVCAEHLRQYNEALVQSNSIRMSDAYSLLRSFYRGELRKKQDVTQTDTEKFLFRQFNDNHRKLDDFSKEPEYENNVLSELRAAILRRFSAGAEGEVRGIIFTETRLSAKALHSWIRENRKFEDVEVRSSYLIGAGDQSAVKPMTASEQKDVLRKFNTGEINLLIATTVAEEGLDIERCNVVIRYCLVTSEIAMIQARGRGRADGSSYIVIGVEGSGVAERERVNECREEMMKKAILGVQQMDKATYLKKVMEYQMEAMMEKKLRERKSVERGRKKVLPSAVKFRCRGCPVLVCGGEDIEVIENAHHVNLTKDFESKFKVNTNPSRRDRTAPCEAEKSISCRNCGHFWGPVMCHRQLDCPCLNIRGFVILQGATEDTLDSWTDLGVLFPEFDFFSHAEQFVLGAEEEDT